MTEMIKPHENVHTALAWKDRILWWKLQSL